MSPPISSSGWDEHQFATQDWPQTSTSRTLQPPMSSVSPRPPRSGNRVFPPTLSASSPGRTPSPNRPVVPPISNTQSFGIASQATSEGMLPPSSASRSNTPARQRDSASVHSQASANGEAWKWENNDPDNQEQALFEQRLTQDIYGVAVRKINQNGKSSLRYVKCHYVDAAELDVDVHGFSSNKSTSSHSRRFRRLRDRSVERSEARGDVSLMSGKQVKVLSWGKKKDVRLPLERFVCVRKGKTTDRSRRNTCPASRILSLITDDPNCTSLDIEAPTKLDRDKFARAFARFLQVPLEGDDVRSIRSDMTPPPTRPTELPKVPSSPRQAPSPRRIPPNPATDGSQVTANSNSRKNFPLPIVTTDKTLRKPIPHIKKTASTSSARMSQETAAMEASASTFNVVSVPSTPSKEVPPAQPTPASPIVTTDRTPQPEVHADPDERSDVSSITGAGLDQEIVEELHLALTDLKGQLEESRAEAARAVKVAEQAIQSAEQSNSKDWNSTVTHKAAEAAALAQKKSAEAMARARMAEERLDQEKRKASLWRKQAESASEEASQWQTRAAAAEVQRAAMEESLHRERRQRPNSSSTGEPNNMESEVDHMRRKLALESATRRKLLSEVQDLRGAVRVYCRPKAPTNGISMSSQEVLLLHRERANFKPNGPPKNTPMSFEFDGILDADMDQQSLYYEMEAVCMSVLDGYKACLMTCGPAGAGKTYTMLGKVTHEADASVSITDYGIQLRAVQQFFSVLQHRKDGFQERMTLTILEVYDDKLTDCMAGTNLGESKGQVEGSKGSRRRIDSYDGTASQSEKAARLEIKTDRDGETTVHGALSVEVSSFEDVVNAWKQSLAKRRQRMTELASKSIAEQESNSHLVATLKVQSTNIATGVITAGKIQFVDLAAADVIPRRSTGSSSTKKAVSPDAMAGVGNNQEWKFANRSMGTLSEVVTARSQFQRKVPYRNSTITHVLSDALESDTKVVLVACVPSDLKSMQEAACTLKFAETARKIVIGKATKHTITAQK